MMLKKILSRTFSLVCLTGFLVQVQQVSEVYFRFETTSSIVYQFRETDYYQSIMYCPRFKELIDYKRLKELGKSFSEESLEDYLRGLSSLAIKDILELTPSESQAIHKCMVRVGRMSSVTIMKQKECEEYFKVIKSVHGEKVCYTFKPSFWVNYTVRHVASSLTHTNAVYEIYAHPSIARGVVAFFISSPINFYGNSKDPLHSVPFQALGQNHKHFLELRFAVYGDSITIHRLPPPFDTNCSPGYNQETCYEDCLIDYFKAINRLPWSGFHRQKLDMKMLNPIDLENKTIARFVETSFEKCDSRCKIKTECLTQFSRTTLQEYKERFLTLSSMLPTVPHMSLYAAPFLNLVQYIVQIGSSFGMWFGLSIISLNPMKWKFCQKKEIPNIVVSNQRRVTFQITRKNRQSN